MEVVGQTPAAKVQTPTAKSIIHQKFGKNASYNIEEVVESTQNGCPGLSIPQQGPCLYRCSLQLLDFSITSEPCKRKKDAEQSAARLAVDKLGLQTAAANPTPQQASDDLISRITRLFSDEFLSSLHPSTGPHPLTGHLRQASRSDDARNGLVPIPILAACDSKLNILCKYVNPKAESNILLTLELILKAARSNSSVAISDGNLWIWKQSPYTQETMKQILDQISDLKEEDISIEAIYIPCSIEKPVISVPLHVLSGGYYMDAIARELGVVDTSHVLVSRTIGKTSSDMRIYFTSPCLPLQLDSASKTSNGKEALDSDASLNPRACYFSGQDIHGDAILAAIGYTWRSKELHSENISLCAYYRMLVGRLPDGGYKLSREAFLAAELPLEFTTRSNWRGSFPRDLLCTFCRQNWLSEPEFSVVNIDESKQSSEVPETHKKLKLSNPSKDAISLELFGCGVKILSKNQDIIIECSPQGSFRRQNDAIQNASLKVLSWLNKYLKQIDMPLDIHGIRVYPDKFRKELSLCLSVHNFQHNSLFESQDELKSFHIEGPDTGVYPSNGCLACICYSISLKQQGEQTKEVVESCNEFEFEIGTGAVSPLLELCVTQMSTDQTASFATELPPKNLIMAAAGDHAWSISQLPLEGYCLEYSVNLVRVTEPSEDRMEQALFSPPLSKQRVEYALKHINESGAATLVDFGCGSGSLLDSLMNYPSSLEKIVGVDISRKGLTRAAKLLHTKLNRNKTIKSATLYDGSITVFDPRLYGVDIGTCLEVIEHMEEDQAQLFGEVVLGYFCPKILIVSTPNYEYNPILQKEDDKAECKFRNHDHKFEWTREQFNRWASELASKYKYSVEFSGVGGSGHVEPGFASQIAVFKIGDEERGQHLAEDSKDEYEVLWEWNAAADDMSTSAL
ncbi:hypothetical protein ACHQM5_000545 [Ranunculus cassubicifolius]